MEEGERGGERLREGGGMEETDGWLKGKEEWKESLVWRKGRKGGRDE